MHRVCAWFVVAILVVLGIAQPASTLARQATPVPDFGVAATIPPLALFDALLATPLPDELRPDDIAPLRAYAWRDANDPDLAGSIGGIIYADIDPFGSRLPAAITYLIYPNASGPLAPLATVTAFGESVEMRFAGKELEAGLVDLGGLVGHFVAIDNVLVYGMVPYQDQADQEAAALTEAGVAHLIQITADAPPVATPTSATLAASQQAFLDVAAAPYPAGDVPFEAGSLVVLPMDTSALPRLEARGLLGALVVRDADRIYRQPLATYRFYSDEAIASTFVSSNLRGVVKATPVALPQAAAIPYPTDIIHRANDTTTVLVQVGSTIVSVEVAQGDREHRRATALTLAEIAVEHLEQATGLAG